VAQWLRRESRFVVVSAVSWDPNKDGVSTIVVVLILAAIVFIVSGVCRGPISGIC